MSFSPITTTLADEDRELAADLGLAQTPLAANDDTLLGTVVVGNATISVTGFAGQWGQSWQFGIVRQAPHGGTLERLTMLTGTGSLTRYWEMAQAIAGGFFSVAHSLLIEQAISHNEIRLSPVEIIA